MFVGYQYSLQLLTLNYYEFQNKMGKGLDISEQRIEDYSSLVGLHFKIIVILGIQKVGIVNLYLLTYYKNNSIGLS